MLTNYITTVYYKLLLLIWISPKEVHTRIELLHNYMAYQVEKEVSFFNALLIFFACFRPYFGQPDKVEHHHLSYWESYITDPKTNSWDFREKIRIENWCFWKSQFSLIGHFDVFIEKKMFCFPWKSVTNCVIFMIMYCGLQRKLTQKKYSFCFTSNGLYSTQ